MTGQQRVHVGWSLLILAWLGTLSPALAGEQKVAIEPREQWTNLFADSDVVFHFKVSCPAGFKGRLEWVFFASANKAVYTDGRGKAALAAAAVVKVPLRTPHVDTGIVQEAVLRVSAYADNAAEPVATFERKLLIFPADPFAGRTKTLAELKITLFDPDPKKKTTKVLEDAKVLFENIPRVEGLDELTEGLVLVGEGVSFKDEPGLAEALVRAAARGRPVLCLAPVGGSFTIPGTDAAGLPVPGGLALRRNDAITHLDKKDKKLDARAWPPDGTLVSHSLVVKADQGKVVAEVVDGAVGWLWLEVDYPDRGGKLIVCSFPVIGRWDAGPAPRYLFARVLDSLADAAALKADKAAAP